MFTQILVHISGFHVFRIGSWFQFNDETVTQIKCLGDVPKKLPKVHEECAKLFYTCVWESHYFKAKSITGPKKSHKC